MTKARRKRIFWRRVKGRNTPWEDYHTPLGFFGFKFWYTCECGAYGIKGLRFMYLTKHTKDWVYAEPPAEVFAAYAALRLLK